MISGIYWIRNLTNNKIYIGSSNDINHRISQHLHDLNRDKHYSTHLQRSFNKYGKENFEFKILITCHPNLLIWYEQQFLDQWKPEYNSYKKAGSPIGFKHSEETKKKISDMQKGRKRHPLSLITKDKIRKGNTGKHLSNETKDKIRNIHITQVKS